MVMTAVPSAASLSTRWNMASVGTGLEKSSYSLQYSHARLHRRVGMMCANRGWSVEANAPAIMRAPRKLRRSAFKRRRTVVPVDGIVTTLLEHRDRQSTPIPQHLAGFAEGMEN